MKVSKHFGGRGKASKEKGNKGIQEKSELTRNLSIVDLLKTALCRTLQKSVLVHLDWATPADAGTGRPVQWQKGRLAVQVCASLDEFWIQSC